MPVPGKGGYRMASINETDIREHLPEFRARASAGERITIHSQSGAAAVLLSTDELQRLERASQASSRLAAALGQDAEVIEVIERGELHPAMLVYGLWEDDPSFDDLVERIRQERAHPSTVKV